MHEPPHSVFLGGLQKKPSAVDAGGHNVVMRIKRQRHGRVDHQVHAVHRLVHRFGVPDVPGDDLDLVLAIVVGKFRQIQRTDLNPFAEQIPDQVDTSEARPARNQDSTPGGRLLAHVAAIL